MTKSAVGFRSRSKSHRRATPVTCVIANARDQRQSKGEILTSVDVYITARDGMSTGATAITFTYVLCMFVTVTFARNREIAASRIRGERRKMVIFRRNVNIGNSRYDIDKLEIRAV